MGLNHRLVRCQKAILCAVLAAMFSTSAMAVDIDGDISLEYRYFFEDPLISKQHDDSLATAVNLRFVEKWRRGREKIVFQPYYRIGFDDDERSHFDVRELYYLNAGRNTEWSVGARKIFWGVTESQHLVDIINQTDQVEGLDGEEKLGQPMLQFAWITRNYGTFNFYALTGFRERTFAGREGRVRLIPKVSNSSAEYESGAEETRVDAAFRWSITLGDWDIGLSHFSGTSRDPNYQIRLDIGDNQIPPPAFANPSADFFSQPSPALDLVDKFTTLVPEYRVIDQTGLDVQAILGAWVLKLEAISRSGQGEIVGDNNSFAYNTSKRYYAAVAGFEYTLYQLFGSDADLGLIAEYSHDSRGDNALSLFEDDVFLGGRLALNDVDGTEVLFGVFRDIDDEELFYSLEGSRRLTSTLSLSIEGRWFSNINNDNYPQNIFDNEDYLQVELTYFF